MKVNSILAHDKLLVAQKLLVDSLSSEILSISLDNFRPVLTVRFLKGLILYIRFNNFNEYTYQIIFSKKKLDRIRYDNYDDRWDVPSKPHHLHPRNQKEAIESPMIGNPLKDIPFLIQILTELIANY